MDRFFALALVLGLGINLLAQQAEKADFVLNVPPHTNVDAPGTSTGRVSGFAFGKEGQPSPPTVNVTLLTFSPQEVSAWGSGFAYAILVENTGDQPVTLPWSSDQILYFSAMRRESSDLLHGGVSVEVYSLDGKTLLATLGVQTIAGSQSIDGPLQVLRKGQKALMSLRGQWTAFEALAAQRVLAQPEGRVRVGARLGLIEDKVNARSKNTIVTRVVPPVR